MFEEVISTNPKLLLSLIILSIFAISCVQVSRSPATPSEPDVITQPMPVPGSDVQETVISPAPTSAQEPTPTSPYPPAKDEPSMMSKSYVIEATDSRATPSSLSISKGTEYTVTFNVDMDGVYYGGLDFRSSKFNSGKILPGKSWTTPTLTADDSYTISAYWPASGVKKWDLKVTVS